MALGQLRALGFGEGAIRHRVRLGRLVRLHHGVYAVGHERLRIEGRWLAAVLACGPGAALSHRSAARSLGLWRRSQARVDVSASRGRAGQPGIELHRPRSLHREDVTEHECIPTTTVHRTLLDLASIVTPGDLERALAQAEVLRLLDIRGLSAAMERANGHRGLRALRGALAIEPQLTRSALERRFLGLVRAARLPEPEVNLWLTLGAGEQFQIDFLWRDEHLAVEADSRRFHDHRRAFEGDRARDAKLTLAGYRPVRFTHRQITTDPDWVVRTLSRLLAPRRSTAR